MSLQSNKIFNSHLKARAVRGMVFYGICLVCVCVGIAALGTLLIQIISDGWSWLTWHFLSDYPSRHPEEAGMMSAIFGTLWVMAMTGIFAVPVGIGSAMFLEEYAPKNKLMQVVEINLANLAGVPSIVYGLLGLAVFVYWMKRKGLKSYTFKWSKEDKLHLGTELIHYCEKLGLVQMVLVRKGKHKSIYYVNTTKKLLREIRDFNSMTEAMFPEWMPMIMPPMDWNYTPFRGGYYGPVIASFRCLWNFPKLLMDYLVQ